MFDVRGHSIDFGHLNLKQGGKCLNIIVFIGLFWSKFESGQSFCELLHEHLLAASHLLKKLKKKKECKISWNPRSAQLAAT